MNVNSYQRQLLLQEWADRIRSQQSSGQNIEKWCLDNDISRDQFHYWKRKLKNLCFESQLPDIVQVSPLSAPQSVNCYTSGTTPIPHTTHSFGSLKISMGDISFEVTESTPDELLLKVIKAVRYA